MTEVRVIGRDGAERMIEADDGSALMDSLRDAGTGVEGTCGGACACGTCHVYIDAAWAARLPARSEDEQMMLDAIGELVEVRATSRLSCQIRVEPGASGLALEIGPVP